MLRLMKLAAYVLFGYFLYEAIKGISEPHDSLARRQPPAPVPAHDQTSGLRPEPISDATGAVRIQRVGRGVRA